MRIAAASFLAHAVVFVALAAAVPPPAPKPQIGDRRQVSSPALPRAAEFSFSVTGLYENPYDPDQIQVDALVRGPEGGLDRPRLLAGALPNGNRHRGSPL